MCWQEKKNTTIEKCSEFNKKKKHKILIKLKDLNDMKAAKVPNPWLKCVFRSFFGLIQIFNSEQMVSTIFFPSALTPIFFKSKFLFR